MQLFLVLFATLAGGLNVIQSGANTTMSKVLAQPLFCSLVVYAAGALALLLSSPFLGLSVPSGKDLAALPVWAWFGGVFGAIYVVSTFYAAGKLGAGLFTGVTVTAGVIVSLTMDHFGWLGFEQHTAGIGRIMGGLLMIGGLVLVGAF